jgi:hypothetical protein
LSRPRTTAPGTTPETFTYTINGGDKATATVEVTAVDVLANETDIDAGCAGSN